MAEEEYQREEFYKQQQQLLKCQDSNNKIQNDNISSTEDEIDVGLPLSPTTSRKNYLFPESIISESQIVNTSTNPPQQREYIISLLFENPNKCISSHSQYDPSLR